jgi:hypothetical protein
MNRPAKIAYEGHLILALTRQRVAIALTQQVTALAREADQPLPSQGATAGGDPERLRGIPVAGKGIAGVWNRSNPEGCISRLDDLTRRLAVLARDIDGTSPGTQPEEEALARG